MSRTFLFTIVFVTLNFSCFSISAANGENLSPIRCDASEMLRGSMKTNSLGHLEIGGVDMVKFIEDKQYPVYVMDEKLVRKNMRDYVDSLKKYYSVPGEVFYASKVLSTLALCKMCQQEGMGLDVSTEGELYTAVQAGFPMEKVIMHGNNKSEAELKMALEYGVGRIVVDNLNDITLLNELTTSLNKVATVMVRVTPAVQAHTNAHIATGHDDSKFGFSIKSGAADEAISKVLDSPALKFAGLHMHIGSQILDVEDYKQAVDHISSFIKQLQDKKILVNELDIGGGLGIVYTCKDKKLEIKDFIKTISGYITTQFTEQKLKLPKLMLEPGRSIVGEAGTTIYKIGSIKPNSNGQLYVAVNGGIADDPRKALYDAQYFGVIANRMNESQTVNSKIVGKACETGDVLIEEILLPRAKYGDIFAIFSTGAYNYSMASNYNRVPVPGMVLVEDGKVKWIVKPQTIQDILRNDLVPEQFK